MPMFPFLAERAISPHPRPDELRPAAYLTDGRRLYYVVSRIVLDGRIESVSLEDCATLQVRAYVPDELYGMKPVQPGGAAR
jgi:hypothetical protein